MNRLVLLACLGLTLTACASAPKPSASEPVAMGETGAIGRSKLPPTHRKRSPYAPAQEDVRKRGHYASGGLYKPGVADNVPGYIPNVDAIPEPDVIDEPRSRYGNRSPYRVLGKSYSVRDTAKGYIERGDASYYGGKFHGRRTSNMEVYDMYAFTAAHRSLPLPSFARVTNLDNGKSVVVRVNDRGPFHDDRIIDLSYAAAVKLGFREQGVAQVEVRGLNAGENARHRYDAVARNDAAVPAVTRTAAATAAPASAAPASTARPSAALPPGIRIATGKPTRIAQAGSTAPPSAPAPAASSATAMDKLVHLLPVASANAGERIASAPVRANAYASEPRASGPQPSGNGRATAAASASPAPAPGREWRFNMLQDGKAMTADEFEDWMQARRARVATGKAGKPVLGSAQSAAGAAAPSPGSPLPSPQAAAAAVAATVTSGGGQVMLQVASFGNATNAGHAVTMLRNAHIGNAQVHDALVKGKQYWRVRVGPVDASQAPDIAARVVALGFDQPHRVRE